MVRAQGEKDTIDIVSNESGIIRWSLAMASAVILKSEMKPDLPGCMIVLDRMWFTRDSDIKVRQYLCNEEIAAKQVWHDQMKADQAKTFWQKSASVFGCLLSCCFILFVGYCVLSTIYGWFP